MLTMNETFVLLKKELSSIDDKEMSCYMSGKVWILTHMSVTLIIELIVLYIWFILCSICFVSLLFNPHWCRYVRNIFESYYLRPHEEDDAEERILSYSIGVVIKEAILIFVYVSLAFIYRWSGLVHDKYMVTSMDFYQWSAEALYIPIILTTTYYFGTIEIFIYLYRSFSLFAILMKIPVFVLMRCAESRRDFFLNDFKAFSFRMLCRQSFK